MPGPVPFVIGVAGGAGSGKTSVCSKIIERLEGTAHIDETRVCLISQESFYKPLSDELLDLAMNFNYDFDHPNAFDFDEMFDTLSALKRRETVRVKQYNFRTRKLSETKTISAVDVIICEGILLFHEPRIRDLFDLKLFVVTNSDQRLIARVLRDVREFGRDLNGVLQHYENYVKPAFDDFCLPTKKHADVIIPRGAENDVAIAVIVRRICELLVRAAEEASSSVQPRSSKTLSFSGVSASDSPVSAAGVGFAPLLNRQISQQHTRPH